MIEEEINRRIREQHEMEYDVTEIKLDEETSNEFREELKKYYRTSEETDEEEDCFHYRGYLVKKRKQ